MKSLSEQIAAYEAYHRDFRNKLTHFVGVPLVTYSILHFFSWLRYVNNPDIPFTGGTVFYTIVFIYYLRLDWKVALLQAPATLTLLFLADLFARRPMPESAWVFVTAFVGGWIIQLIGHAFEGRRPALADNFLQIFNAPLFLTTEVMQSLGYAKNLRPQAS